MTFNDVLYGFAFSFTFLAAYILVGLESRRYVKTEQMKMRTWGVIWSLLAIWSFVWAISTGS